MKKLRNFSMLAIALVIASASLQCRRPEGSGSATSQPAGQGETAGPNQSTTPGTTPPVEPAATPPVDLGVMGKDAHESSAKLAVADIQQMVDAKDYDRAKVMAAAAQSAYADTAVAPQLAALTKSIDAGAAAAPPKVDPTTLSQAEQDALHDSSVKDRDAALVKLADKQPAEAVTLLQASLRQENDPNTQAMLQQATAAAEGKPRLAVAQFDVIGDVGIIDAGRAIPELLLSKFDLKRFQLVERTAVNCALADQGLSVAQITENPALLRIKKVSAVRYLVVGSVVKVGTLAASARLVDAASGEIVQTAEVTANDAVGLQNSLAELAAVLQMTNDEKANYLAYKQRQQEAQSAATATTDVTTAQPPDVPVLPPAETLDPVAPPTDAQYQADLQAERDRIAAAQADAFQNSQRQRDAAVALAQVQALLVRGDAYGARGYAAWAAAQFGDTDAGPQLAAMQPAIQAACDNQDALQRNADDWARARREQRQRFQRYCAFRDQGMTALAANDLRRAAAAFQSALQEQDDPNMRGLLDQIVQASASDGITVLDFAVQGDLGTPDAGRSLAAYMLDQFGRSPGRLRLIPRDQFLAQVSQVGLTVQALLDNPTGPQATTLRLLARFVVIGQVARGPAGMDLTATLLDLTTGRPVQQARATVQNLRSRRLSQALAEMTALLLMTDAEKQAFTRQQDYANWMAKADGAIFAGRWDEALACYRRANEMNPTNEARDGISNMSQRIAGLQQARQNYDAAMLAGQNAANAGDWISAMAAYQQALTTMNTPDARNALANARKNAGKQAADANRLYDSLMADARASAKAGNWARARDDYQQAVAVNPTPDAQAGLKLAQTTLDQQLQDRRRQFDRAIADARAAVRAGDWQKALDGYMRAAAVQDTPETRAGIASARQALAQQALSLKLYETAMADASAAAQAGDWAKAVDAYQRALALNRTPQAQAGLTQARQKLADQQRQAEIKRLYDLAMADGDAAARIPDWKRSLDSYTKAAAIRSTPQAQAGIAAAKEHLADAAETAAAAAQKKKNYDAAIADALAHVRAGDWQKALDAYTKAARIDNTAEADAGITTARKHLADAAGTAAAAGNKKKNYDAAIAEALIHVRAGDWQKALDAYTKAARIDNTAEADAGITSARKHLADAAGTAAAAGDKKKNYDAAIADALTHVKAGDWQNALDAYTKASGFDNTADAQAGIAAARKHLADATAAALAAAEKKKNYDAAMAEALAAANAGDWRKALTAYTKAAGIDNTVEAQNGIATAEKHLTAPGPTAAEKKKNYDAAMAEALAFAKAGDWQKALDSYTKAAGIDNTPEAQAGIAAAKKRLADAAAAAAAAGDKKKNYDAAIAEALVHARAGDWQGALDAYTKASGFENTAEAQAGIAASRKRLADAVAAATSAAEKKKNYDAAMADALAAAKAGDWQKALAAYSKAAGIDNTVEARNGIATAEKHVAAAADAAAAAQKKKNYDAAMAEALAFAKAGNWQKALDAYTKAAGIDNTAEAQAGIATAKKHLADAAAAAAGAGDKKKNYDAAMAEALGDAKAGNWQKALDAYTKAAGIDNTAEAQAGIVLAKRWLAYEKLMTDAVTAFNASDWPTALDDYTKAAALENTPAAQAGIAATTKKWYDKCMADGKAAMAASQWQKALDAYTKAYDLMKTPEAKAGMDLAKKKLGP